MNIKSNNKLKVVQTLSLIIILLLLITSVFSCDSEEEDPYISTELSGLYKYKTAYMKPNCNNEETGYTINLEDELAQPYFLLEGRRGYDDSSHDILMYDCVDRRYDECIKTDDNDYEIENILATGYDGNWRFKTKVSTEYDYAIKACRFIQDKVSKYTLSDPPIGLDDSLEIIVNHYYYEDKDISAKDCRINKIEYSSLICVAQKKYTSQRIVLNEQDQEYFNEKNKTDEESSYK